DDVTGKLLAHGFHKSRLFHRLGADDDPLHAGIQIGLDDLRVADAAADLDRQVRVRLRNRLDDLAVDRLAGEGAIEVHQMQTARAALDPVPGHRHRVIGEHGVVFHATLFQAHAFAVFQVDGGDQLHSNSLDV